MFAERNHGTELENLLINPLNIHRFTSLTLCTKQLMKLNACGNKTSGIFKFRTLFGWFAGLLSDNYKVKIASEFDCMCLM